MPPAPGRIFAAGRRLIVLILTKCGTRHAPAEGVPTTFPLEAGMRIAHISAGSPAIGPPLAIDPLNDPDRTTQTERT